MHPSTNAATASPAPPSACGALRLCWTRWGLCGECERVRGVSLERRLSAMGGGGCQPTLALISQTNQHTIRTNTGTTTTTTTRRASCQNAPGLQPPSPPVFLLLLLLLLLLPPLFPPNIITAASATTPTTPTHQHHTQTTHPGLYWPGANGRAHGHESPHQNTAQPRAGVRRARASHAGLGGPGRHGRRLPGGDCGPRTGRFVWWGKIGWAGEWVVTYGCFYRGLFMGGGGGRPLRIAQSITHQPTHPPTHPPTRSSSRCCPRPPTSSR